MVGKQLSVILKCAFVGIVFLTRTPGSHWWITLLRAVAGSRFVCFPFVSPDTGIPEDRRAESKRPSFFLFASWQPRAADHALICP